MPDARIVHRTTGTTVWRMITPGGIRINYAEIPDQFMTRQYDLIVTDDFGLISNETLPPRREPVMSARTRTQNSPPTPVPVPDQITTLDEAKAAFLAFQDRLYTEATERGYTTSYTSFLETAAREIPAVEMDRPADPGTATLNVVLTIPFEIPANPERNGGLARDELRRQYKEWGRANGYDGDLTGSWAEALARFVLAHPERMRIGLNQPGFGTTIDTYGYRSDQPAIPPRLRFVATPENADENAAEKPAEKPEKKPKTTTG